MSEKMTTEQSILEDYRQDAIDQVERVGELLREAAGMPNDKELHGICLAAELATNKLRRYFGKAWGHGNEHGSAA